MSAFALLIVLLFVVTVAAFNQQIPSSKLFAAKPSTSFALRASVEEEVKCGPCPLAPKCKGLYSTKGAPFRKVSVSVLEEDRR